MADNRSSTAEDHKRDIETAAEVVLAKHPSVVAGSAPPAEVKGEVTAPKPVDIVTRNIDRGLSR